MLTILGNGWGSAIRSHCGYYWCYKELIHRCHKDAAKRSPASEPDWHHPLPPTSFPFLGTGSHVVTGRNYVEQVINFWHDGDRPTARLELVKYSYIFIGSAWCTTWYYVSREVAPGSKRQNRKEMMWTFYNPLRWGCLSPLRSSLCVFK